MIELEKLSTSDLSKLISAAMNEYQRRLSAPAFVATLETQAPVVIPPTEADKAHVSACLRLLKTGGVIRADDVREYRRIANEFPDWMRQKRYPDDVRGAAARRYVDFNA